MNPRAAPRQALLVPHAHAHARAPARGVPGAAGRLLCRALGRGWRVLAALLLAGQVLAAPAPWYWWRSKVDGARICAQTSPGAGWERDSPPYAGPGCAPKPRVFVVPMR